MHKTKTYNRMHPQEIRVHSTLAFFLRYMILIIAKITVRRDRRLSECPSECCLSWEIVPVAISFVRATWYMPTLMLYSKRSRGPFLCQGIPFIWFLYFRYLLQFEEFDVEFSAYLDTFFLFNFGVEREFLVLSYPNLAYNMLVTLRS